MRIGLILAFALSAAPHRAYKVTLDGGLPPLQQDMAWGVWEGVDLDGVYRLDLREDGNSYLTIVLGGGAVSWKVTKLAISKEGKVSIRAVSSLDERTIVGRGVGDRENGMIKARMAIFESKRLVNSWPITLYRDGSEGDTFLESSCRLALLTKKQAQKAIQDGMQGKPLPDPREAWIKESEARKAEEKRAIARAIEEAQAHGYDRTGLQVLASKVLAWNVSFLRATPSNESPGVKFHGFSVILQDPNMELLGIQKHPESEPSPAKKQSPAPAVPTESGKPQKSE